MWVVLEDFHKVVLIRVGRLSGPHEGRFIHPYWLVVVNNIQIQLRVVHLDRFVLSVCQYHVMEDALHSPVFACLACFWPKGFGPHGVLCKEIRPHTLHVLLHFEPVPACLDHIAAHLDLLSPYRAPDHGLETLEKFGWLHLKIPLS